MFKLVAAAMVGLFVVGAGGGAWAGPYADELGRCFVRSTSADDKVVLAQWMFAAMSRNKSVKTMVSVADANREGFNRQTGLLFERLLTVDCRKELVEALKNEGRSALKSSNETLGRAASAELLRDPAVEAEAAKFTSYWDSAKIAAVLREGGVSNQK